MIPYIDVLFEDENIIVCIKPDGVLSQGDKSGSFDMVRLLKSSLVLRAGGNSAKEPYIGAVHRLDRNVRGVMVYAKTGKAAAELSKLIRENKINKRYLAVVSFDKGKELPQRGGWIEREDYILFDRRINLSVIAEESRINEADRAKLYYRVLSAEAERALVEIKLITGRHHQIRLQMSQLFNGVAGDTKYNKDYRQAKGIYTPALEAVALDFKHPITGKDLSFKIVPKGKEFERFDSENYI